MHGGFCRWFACALAGVAVSAITQPAWGQEERTLYPPADPGYSAQGTTSQFVTTAYSAAEKKDGDKKDMEKRVADLEKALEKMKKKEEDTKKKDSLKPTCKIGGRIHLDQAWFGQNADSRAIIGDAQDATYFRRARLKAYGDMFDNVSYCAEFDFAGFAEPLTGVTGTDTNVPPDGQLNTVTGTTGIFQQTLFREVEVDINELPYLQTVRIGHYKEPFSLEEVGSDNNLTFIERSLANFLVPSYNIGTSFLRSFADENATLSMGVFRDVPDNPPLLANDNARYDFASRATWTPWYDEGSGGRGLLHVGGGYVYRCNDGSSVRYRSRPEVGLFRDLTRNIYTSDTGNITGVYDQNLFNVETAFVYGALSAQAEYIALYVNPNGLDNTRMFEGYYAQVGYFLTGEHRPYKRTNGTFDRVKPFTNFFRVRTCDDDVQMGWGAWEVAYRYSYLDLNDGATVGGIVTDNTFGVNWYLNPYTRMMFNYVHSDVQAGANGPLAAAGAGDKTYVDVFETRFQIDF